MKDFFISYNRHDKAWAEWIAWMLEVAGYTVVIEAWDFRAGGNFELEMHRAASDAERTIAVLSANYLNGRFTHPEWAAAFAQDPTGEKHLLVPVRVGTCDPKGLLGPIIYVDLMDLAEAEAKDLLLRSLAEGRGKPDEKPYFPGSGAATSDRPKPVFPPSIPCNLPSVSSIFVGREEELEALHTQLQTGDTIAISAVSGMGGIGKTELAAQYALQQRDMGTYPGGICWLKAREDLNTQIVLFARSHLELTIPEDLELPAQVAYCWRNWQPGATLLVFDDVQAYKDVAAVAIPQRSQFRILLTTRLKLQSPVQDFEIKVLSEEKAIELLRAIVTDGRIDQDLATAKQICQWLGYLPLGIELVGRYLALETGVSLEEMLARLQQESLEQPALVRDENDPTWTASAERGVAAAFELSWKTLDAAAQQLGELLSLFALAPIPWELVEATIGERNAAQRSKARGWRRWLAKVWHWLQHLWRKPALLQPQATLQSVAAVEKARSSLLRLHLLERTEQGMYQLHQLLREFFAAKREQRADVNEMKQAFCQAMVAAAKQIPQTPTLSIIEQVTSAIPHIKEATTVLAYWLTDKDLITPSTHLGWFYKGQAAYAEAKEWLEQCRVIVTQRFGADHPIVAVSLINLAQIYKVQGHYAEAEPLLTRALGIHEREFGKDQPLVAISLNNLAGLYTEQGRYLEAEALYIRAQSIYDRKSGADDLDVANNLNNLAKLYYLQEHYSKAKPLCIRALNIRERKLEADHLDLALSLSSLALLYDSQGDYAEAEPLYIRVLSICEHKLGADHPDVAGNLNNLAGLYRAQGRYTEAEPLYIRALNIRECKLGADHPDVAGSLNNLALHYQAQDHYAKAEPLYRRAVSILFEKLGADHPNTQMVWRNFLGFLQQVLEAGQAGQLSDHPLTQDLLRQMREGSGEDQGMKDEG